MTSEETTHYIIRPPALPYHHAREMLGIYVQILDRLSDHIDRGHIQDQAVMRIAMLLHTCPRLSRIFEILQDPELYGLYYQALQISLTPDFHRLMEAHQEIVVEAASML